MSKPIILTEEMKKKVSEELVEQLVKKLSGETLLKDATESIGKMKMSDGKFSFKKDFSFERKFEYEDKRRATLGISMDAYAKMLSIVAMNDKEVGWHGTTHRVSDDEFVIDNVYVYPQTVTAATVDTDDEEYAKWLISLDKIDENIFPNLHFHGHSHVNFGCTPSATDMSHRRDIVSQLSADSYYIFMIINKSLEITCVIYDFKTNTLYETDDIDLIVQFQDCTLGDIQDDIDAKVSEKVYTKAPAAFKSDSKKSTGGKAETGNGLDDFRGGGYDGYGYSGSGYSGNGNGSKSGSSYYYGCGRSWDR